MGDGLLSSSVARTDGEFGLERLRPTLDALHTVVVIRVEPVTTRLPAGGR